MLSLGDAGWRDVVGLTGVAAALTPKVLGRVREALAARGIDGWLLFDFHGINPVARRVLGSAGLATRRLFVLLPAVGPPVAIAHRIELQPLEDFPGEVRPYATWRELERELARLLAGRRVAMEYAARDAVPYLDRVPAGVVELVRGSGAEVVSSADLVTLIAARWTARELSDHRRAALALVEIALGALVEAQRGLGAGEVVTESGLQRWIMEAFDRRGLTTDEAPIVAAGPHSANPHFQPSAEDSAPLRGGEVLLIDLWARVATDTVFADQTWMGYLGRTPPSEVSQIFTLVRDARDRAVALLRDRWREGWSVTGADLDDAARAVVRAAGYADYFVHRTGHSIDRELHGSGPHLDNFETQDNRLLMPGVGFSVEPGVYLPGRFGVRSEINVYLDEGGPIVTPADPQRDLICLPVPTP